jgi:hypothetical protein
MINSECPDQELDNQPVIYSSHCIQDVDMDKKREDSYVILFNIF